MSAGDEVIVSAHGTSFEHRALADPGGVMTSNSVIPMKREGRIERTKSFSPTAILVSVAHVSNVLGNRQSRVKEIIRIAHEHGVPKDGQPAPHLKVDVQHLDAEFYVFRHKIGWPDRHWRKLLWQKRNGSTSFRLIRRR